MRIIYTQGKGVKQVTLDPTTKVGQLIKEVSPATVGLPDTQEDQEVFLLDEHEELSKDATLKDHKAFVIHRCKKIAVTVVYAGKPPFTHKYGPATVMKHIRKDAIEKLGIDGPAGQSLELFESTDQNSKVNRNYPLGYFSEYPTCSIQFYLADPNAFAG
jgi:hypothetical protein